jgi:translation initiation factor 4B
LGGFDDPKFSGEWRRQGPLPDLGSRDPSRRRHDGPPADRDLPPTSMSDTSSDWRSNRPMRPPPPPEPEAAPRRKASSLASESAGVANKEETWTIGGKFKPSEDEGPGRKFGSFRGRGDMGPPSSAPDPPADGDWRSGPRPGLSSRSSTSRESCISTRWGQAFTRGRSIIIHTPDSPAHAPETGASATFRGYLYNTISACIS